MPHDYSTGLPATVVVADPAIDTEHLLFEHIDTYTKGPRFSVGEVSKTFFARSSQWLRDQENEGYLVVEGVGMVIPRREGKYARYYTLADIEMVAHALAYHRRISGSKLRSILLALKSIGEVWRFL
jgi:DNA-binding transcriptional ArsR family regulator